MNLYLVYIFYSWRSAGAHVEGTACTQSVGAALTKRRDQHEWPERMRSKLKTVHFAKMPRYT